MNTKVYLTIFFLIGLLLALYAEALAGPVTRPPRQIERQITTPVKPGGPYHTEQLQVEPQPPQYQPSPQQMKMESQPPQYQAPVPEGQFAPQAPGYQAPASPTGPKTNQDQDQKTAPPKYQSPDEWLPKGTK
jgi:hypothetical protein